MKPLVLVLSLLLTVGLTACTNDTASVDTPTTQTPDADRVFTTAELAQYNGRNGQPTYVAVNGIVYDLSTSSLWVNGNHNGVQAGQDLTSIFAQQHGDSRLDRYPVVGTLRD
jgi:predicted heme/steroid binding protein